MIYMWLLCDMCKFRNIHSICAPVNLNLCNFFTSYCSYHSITNVKQFNKYMYIIWLLSILRCYWLKTGQMTICIHPQYKLSLSIMTEYIIAIPIKTSWTKLILIVLLIFNGFFVLMHMTLHYKSYYRIFSLHNIIQYLNYALKTLRKQACKLCAILCELHNHVKQLKIVICILKDPISINMHQKVKIYVHQMHLH